MLLTQTIKAPGQEPVTVDDVKVSARIDPDITDLDAQIGTLVTAARQMAEHECGRTFVNQAWELVYSAWPADELPLSPIASLDLVEAFDGAAWQPVPDVALELAANGTSKLSTASVPPGRVRVTVQAGVCPDNVKAWIIAMTVHMLTTATSARPTNPPAYLSGLLDRERDWR